MNPMKKLLFFALIIAVAFLAGCDKIINQQKDSASSQVESAADTQRIRVALWDYGTVEYDKKLIDAFSEQNAGVQIEVISTPGTYYDNKLTVMFAGGEDIDVFYVRISGLLKNLVLKDIPRTMDDLIARDNIEIKPYGNIKDSPMTIDGKIYGLPYRKDWMVLYYNKDIFDKNNVPYPNDDITWEDYREIGRKLTSGEGNDKTYGIFINGLSGCIIPQGGEGFNMVDSDLNLLRPGIELYMNIQTVDKSAVDYATNKSLNADQRTFEKGRSGMFINGTWFINYLVNDRKAGKFDFDWGAVRIPHWKGEEPSMNIAYTPVCINAKTDKLEAAWAFVKFITGKEGAGILAQELIIPGYIDDEVLAVLSNNPDFPQLNMDFFKEDEIFKSRVPDKLEGPIRKVVMEEIELIITNNKSLDQGIADMMKRRQEIIDQNK